MPIPNNQRVSVDELRERFCYDAETGGFVWRRHRRSDWLGAKAGTVAFNGYLYLSLRGYKLLAHRAAWAYVHGAWPVEQIDHISRDRLDNRITNLRIAEPTQNMANCAVRPHNRCGVKGVQERKGKFVAFLSKNRKQRYLGTYGTPEQAHAAYMAAARQMHGEFAHDGSL